ncbi:iron-siderophore ABC transporter substrate-binding protein [Paenibacillus sp. IB182496]|uniref:Iron-siderophore ABC transporter substrate-binding protein n=1 Tax=Paenibacillus sabuli TaxID=2772509 RepID=A0A927GQV0_9BACL|nr:iron-siderophore ABC transporter substrate-binding protein [Paenibacillus sabuli]MBD2844758.1 iron-siderophore ABC transporter substrate-binding protein [Paenibacillus sabuli]
MNYNGIKWWTCLICLCSLVLVTACGGTSPSQSSQSESDHASPTSDSAESHSDQPIMYTDDYGREVKITGKPQRILGVYLEDPLVALGLTPLLQFNFGGAGAAYLQRYIADVPLAGSTPMPAPERVLELDPDLIITHSLVLAADKIEPYAKIAPTYAIDASTSGWKDILLTIGTLVGESEKAQQLLETYDQSLSDARERLQRQVGTDTFALVRIANDKDIRLYRTDDPFSGELLYDDLGLKPAALVETLPEDGNISISMEVIPQLTADHIILVINDNGKAQAEELLASPLWQGLPAYQNDQIYEVDASLWLSLGYIANTGKIEDLLARTAE